MPDRDVILRGLHRLPRIENRGLDGNLLPKASIAWVGKQYDAAFWVTYETRFGRGYFVLRTKGDRRDRARVEENFVKHLGEPDFLASELGIPVVDTTLWREDKIKSQLAPPRIS